jgi:subtilisin family serine protease
MPESTSISVDPASPLIAGRSGRGVSVAIVDSGMADNHPHVGTTVGGVGVSPDGTVTDDWRDLLGHGTAVAAAIREKAPSADLLSVKVFHRALHAAVGTLVQGISWSVNRRARLINLSLGTANAGHQDILEAAVKHATAQGALIVSAFESNGNRWFPGSIHGAVPVVLDDSCPRNEIRVVQRRDVALFAASGYPRPIPGIPVERNLQGISFAVANVTGMLACMLESQDHLTNVGRVIDWITKGWE